MSLLHGVRKIRRPRGPIIKPTIKKTEKKLLCSTLLCRELLIK